MVHYLQNYTKNPFFMALIYFIILTDDGMNTCDLSTLTPLPNVVMPDPTINVYLNKHIELACAANAYKISGSNYVWCNRDLTWSHSDLVCAGKWAINSIYYDKEIFVVEKY